MAAGPLVGRQRPWQRIDKVQGPGSGPYQYLQENMGHLWAILSCSRRQPVGGLQEADYVLACPEPAHVEDVEDGCKAGLRP